MSFAKGFGFVVLTPSHSPETFVGAAQFKEHFPVDVPGGVER